MTDPLIQKARRVRDEYKEHNKGTIERPVRIDSRTIIYEKVKTDENAAKFADSLKKMERQERVDKQVSKVKNNTAKRPLTIKTPFPKRPKAVKDPKPVPPPKPKRVPKPKVVKPKRVKAVKPPKPPKPPKVKKVKPPKPPKIKKPKAVPVRSTARADAKKLLSQQIYKMAKSGLTQVQICERMNKAHSTVSRHIIDLEKRYGSFYKLHRRTKGGDGLSAANREVKSLLDKGMSREAIARTLGKSKSTIKYHIDLIQKNK